MARFAGSTEDAAAPFLNSEWWKKGTKLEGTVNRLFQTDNGTAFVLSLRKPTVVKVNGENVDQVSIGLNLAGLTMALQAAGVPGASLKVGDSIIIENTGTTDTGKGNPRLDFKIAVDRPD